MRLIFLVFIIFISFNFSGFSQDSKRNSWITVYHDNVHFPLTDAEANKIESAYGKHYLNEIKSSKSLLKDLKDILRNRVSIEIERNKDISKFPPLSSIKLNEKASSIEKIFSVKNFNPLKYNFDFYSKIKQIYRVEGTNYIIIINPKVLK